MNITSAQYRDLNGQHDNIITVIDGKTYYVPLDSANIHYQEILKQVAEGKLTIADAE